MRQICFILGLAVALPAAADEPKDGAMAIVDKAIAAHGGIDKLDNFKAQHWKAKGKLTAQGMTMEYVAEYLYAPPGNFRFDLDMVWQGNKVRITAATDGKSAWELAGPMLEDMPKAKQVEFHHNIYVIYLTQVAPLKDKGLTLTSLGESKHGEQTLVGIKVECTGKREVNIFFDKKTDLVARTSSRIFDEFTKKEVTQETIMTNYRDKDGRKEFTRLTHLRDGKETIVEDLSDMKYLDKVDVVRFTKPARTK